MNIGENIKKFRLEKKLTQVQLGKLIGVAGATVTRYENGKIIPDFEMMDKISEALDITPIQLVGWNGMRSIPHKSEIEEIINNHLNKIKFPVHGMRKTWSKEIFDSINEYLGFDLFLDFVPEFIKYFYTNYTNNKTLLNLKKSIDENKNILSNDIEYIIDSSFEELEDKLTDSVYMSLMSDTINNIKKDLHKDLLEIIKKSMYEILVMDIFERTIEALNNLGIEKAFDYIMDLSEQPKYTDKE